MRRAPGGTLSERDVCCRARGTVAVPALKFEENLVKCDSDQLNKPVSIRIINPTMITVDAVLQIIKGDAQLISIGETAPMPSGDRFK